MQTSCGQIDSHCSGLSSAYLIYDVGKDQDVCHKPSFSSAHVFPIHVADELDNQYSHNEAVRDMHLGFRAALWMALFGFLASAVHRNLDSLDHCAMRGQDYAVRCMQHAK